MIASLRRQYMLVQLLAFYQLRSLMCVDGGMSDVIWGERDLPAEPEKRKADNSAT